MVGNQLLGVLKNRIITIFLALIVLILFVNYFNINRLSCYTRNKKNIDAYFDEPGNELISASKENYLEAQTRLVELAMVINNTNLNNISINGDKQHHYPNFPNILKLLPHLRNRVSYFLEPRKEISKNRRAKLVIGIPTVKRAEENYLFKTLNSLVKSCSKQELKDVLIVVFIAEIFDDIYTNETISQLEKSFEYEISRGIIDIVVPPAEFYPNLSHTSLPHDFVYNDHPDRIKWRIKQNYDISYLMNYAKSRAKFYLQLEDDVLSRSGFVTEIFNYLAKINTNFDKNRNNIKWLVINFSPLGFIGKLFRSADLNMLINMFLMFADYKPVDVILDHTVQTIACDLTVPLPKCKQIFDSVKVTYTPSLFQHIGLKSSLKGKIQKIKDTKFNENPVNLNHNPNPAAKINTTLRAYFDFSLEKFYHGASNKPFWAFNLNKTEYIIFDFIIPFKLNKFVVRSGSGTHPDDVIPVNSTLEVKLVNDQELKIYNSNYQRQKSQRNFTKTSDNYYIIAKFEDNGSGGVDNLDEPSLNVTITSVRILIQGPTQNWILLSELGFY